MMNLKIVVYQDGDNETDELNIIRDAWGKTWAKVYNKYASISFDHNIVNVKAESPSIALPTKLKVIAAIRNPDIYFYESTNKIELGGVEITTHSPDGSNIEKRYPYIWISRKLGVNAFIATPYSKTRPPRGATGRVATNRLPHRLSKRNIVFAREWDPDSEGNSVICQILPIIELQGGSLVNVEEPIKTLMFGLDDLGSFFAHLLASKILPKSARAFAKNELRILRLRMLLLAHACTAATTDTEASTLLRVNADHWIQIYNTRPDTGHWERGEGQFDSIDGRLMFTLDGISLLPVQHRPKRFECWLPQMTSRHPWIVEQIERGFGSKRLRNILQVINDQCVTKFANDLSDKDWLLLQNTTEQSLLLEREDWKPGLYKVTELVAPKERASVARIGLEKGSKKLSGEMETLLGNQNLYFSTHRAYKKGWASELRVLLSQLPSDAEVLIPRIPGKLLPFLSKVRCKVIAAESCTKNHLLLLRQLHKHGYARRK
ncbi:MAG: hypothetical protein QOE33_3517 [Acidobacteriota bacterium]|nr:hypothetical protein [Acidobacteriota bacterium]